MEESLETEYCREQWKFRKFDNAKCFQEEFFFREIESILVKGGYFDIFVRQKILEILAEYLRKKWKFWKMAIQQDFAEIY